MTLDARIAAASAAVRTARTPAEEAAAETALAELLVARDAAKYGPPPTGASRNPAPSAGGWEPPVSFDATGDLPAFPTDALPGPVASWVRAEATSTQTPEDLPGMVALSVLSTAVAKKYRATIRPEWREPLTVYAAVTLPPGERKSAVFRDATAPLLDWEREAIQHAAPLLREASIAFEIAEGRLKDAKGRAIRARGADRLVAEEEVRGLNEDMASLPRPVLPRLLADDVTPERMFGILAEQGGRLGILSAEGGLFDLLAGRYSDGLPNLDAFLKAHSGDQLRVDRVGRPPEHLREPVLTVGLTVQPVVITGLADRPGFRGRGLLARFLYSLPKSKVGHRLVDPPPVPPEVTAAYAATVRRLLDLPADRGEDGEIVSRDLPFSREAVEALLGLSADLEPRLGEGGDLEGLRDWAAKLPGAVARVAGVLALAAEVDSGHSGHSGHPTPVQRDAVERAILLGRYLVPHALAAFGLMGTKKEVEDAKHLLRWILAERRERFTKRDAWRGTRGRFEKAEDLDLPLRELEARGYFRQEPEDRREGPGRKPSPTYTVNPLAYGQNGHNGQNSAAGNGRRVPATVPVESPDSREIACPHCGARSGQSHWRGRESACPRAEAPPVAQVGGGA